MAGKNQNLKIVLIIAALIIGYNLILSVLTPFRREKTKETVENKVVYIPSDITKKYSEDFKKVEIIIDNINKNIENSEEEYVTNKIVMKRYKDKNDRVIYEIKENTEVYIKHNGGGRGGFITYQKDYPSELGYVYDNSGKIKNKIEIKGSNSYRVNSEYDNNSKSFLKDKQTPNMITVSTINYDKKGNKIKEEIVRVSEWYEKEITEYADEKKKIEKKIIDNESDYEPLNKIYVEITKEYDETEKLIKKFVLRKNKFNTIRSETNFDFIKGEIVTKYYDGEKAFATVTETLIGKDRAIVKRERVGDEFVIWDFQIKELNKINSEIYITRKNNILYKTNKFISESGGSYQTNIYGVNEDEYLWETYDNLNFKTDYGNDFSIVVWNFNSVIGIEDNKINKYELTEEGIYFLKELKNKTEKEWLKNNSKIKNDINKIELNIEKIREDFANGY
jgi:hypothetical protein